MNTFEATRQLLRRLAFNLHNFGLSEIELKLVVSVNFTVTGLSWVDYNLELNTGRIQSLWDEQQWVVAYGGQCRPSRLARRQHDSPALMFHAYTARPIGDVRPEALVIMDEPSYCGPVRTVRSPYTRGRRGQCGWCIHYLHPPCCQTMMPFENW